MKLRHQPGNPAKLWLAGSAMIAAFLLTTDSSFATIRTVSNLNDRGAGSLRDAIAASSDNDVINFQSGLTGTIGLTTGDLEINDKLTIIGPGISQLTISGTHQSRIFNINPTGNLYLSSVRVADGNVQGADGTAQDADGSYGYGGGLNNAGDLTLSNCLVTLNSVTGGNGADEADIGYIVGGGGNAYGAGIYSTGVLALTNCSIILNTATGGAGASDPTGGGGGANAEGSGISVTAGTLALMGCTVAENVATGGAAGTGYGVGPDGSTGFANGGGMAISDCSMTMANSTIANNSANNVDGSVNSGGGLYFEFDGSVTIFCCTISGNSCTGYGGGIDAFAASDEVYLANTIIAGNTVGGDPAYSIDPDVHGQIEDFGFNLIGNVGDSGVWDGNADLLGQNGAPLNPRLGPLRDNGGPTMTMALLPNSPAVDQGYSSGYNTDQRGSVRPYVYPGIPSNDGGDGSDIGAFEVDPTRPILTIYPGLTHLNIAWSENEPGTGPLNGGPYFGLIFTDDLTMAGEYMSSMAPVRFINNMYIAKEMVSAHGILPGTGVRIFQAIGPATNVNFFPPAATTSATGITTNGATLNGNTTPLGDNTLYWFVYGSDTNYGESTVTNSLDTSTNLAELSQTISGLTAQAVYHFQLMVTDSDGTQAGGDQSFTIPAPAPPPPTVVTLAASGLTPTSAVLNGSINGYGMYDAAYFEYGLDESYGSSTYSDQFFGDGYFQDYTNIVSGLAAGTTYHYRAVGSTLNGQGFGQDQTFTTTATSGPATPPTVQTLAASFVTESTAVLNGSANPNGADSTAFFEWGTDTTYGNLTTQTGIDTTPQSDFQATLSGLASNTTYHYRMDANNSAGISYGADATFTTAWAPVPPTLASPGTSTPGSPGLATTTPTFTWIGASPAASFDLVILGYPNGNVVFDGSVGGSSYTLPSGFLANETAYEWYMVSFNNLGDESAASSPLYFTTAAQPTVVTLPATNIVGSLYVKLSGSVNPNGGATTAYFEYGTTTNYGNVTTQTGIGTTEEIFTATTGSLTAGATYHYRIDAVNGIGLSHGSDVTFVAP